MKNFENQVSQLVSQIEPEVDIYPVVCDVSVASLEEVDKRYGVDSDNPLQFHNAPHSVDVTRRVIRLTNLLHDLIPGDYKHMMYPAGMLAGTSHDVEQMLDGEGENERASTQYLREEIEKRGKSPINNEPFKVRTESGVLASQVEFAQSGELVQVNLRQGEPDPLKFFVAFADINGIAMEGNRRMIRDATNLCYEIHGGDPGAEELYDFLLTQAGFLKSRLNDYRMIPDIEYYFPDKGEEVYERMKKAYNKNITSAYRLALLLHESDEFRNTIDHAMSALDKTHIGPVIGKFLRKL